MTNINDDENILQRYHIAHAKESLHYTALSKTLNPSSNNVFNQ